jgi:hypothetical protein
MAIDTFQDAPATLIPGAAPIPGAVENKRWYWSQAVKKAEVLVARLGAAGLAPEPLQATLGEQQQAHETVLSVETELAVERALLDEPVEEEHEAESRMRNAIIDLGIEQDRLSDSGVVDEQAWEDLDYQIRVLETNLGELYRQMDQRQANQEETVREMETYADLCDRKLRDVESRLIQEVFEARPQPCPADLAAAYVELADTLRAYDIAEE